MKDYNRFDRIVFKQNENYWSPKPGTKGVINKVNPNSYEIGLDTGNYYWVDKDKADELFMLDSKLLKALK